MFFLSFRASGSVIPEETSSLAGVSTNITSVVAHGKGFACACGVGTVHLYEKSDEKDFYRKSRVVKVTALFGL